MDQEGIELTGESASEGKESEKQRNELSGPP